MYKVMLFTFCIIFICISYNHVSSSCIIIYICVVSECAQFIGGESKFRILKIKNSKFSTFYT